MIDRKKYEQELSKSSIHVNDAFLDKILANSRSTKPAFGHIMDIEGNFLELDSIYNEIADYEKADLLDFESMERRNGRTYKKR